MDFVHFLNLEYFIALIYQAFTGSAQRVDIPQVPHQTLVALTWVGWAGIALSALLAFGIYLARRQFAIITGAGWHRRDEEIRALAARHDPEAPVNPRWENILMFADSEHESDWRRAIIEADTMLDEMLMSQGYAGENLGERLRGANPLQFTTLDLAWAAHKVRNDIAHRGMEFQLTEREVRATIDLYRRVFEEFNYL